MKYAKAVWAAVGGLATSVTAVLADNVIGLDEWGTLASALAVAVVSVVAVAKAENAQ